MSEVISNWRSQVASPTLHPNKAVAECHVKAITGNAETPMRWRFINPATKSARTFGPVSLSSAWPEIQAAQASGKNVYIVVNEGGDTDASITRIRALFVDSDSIPQPVEWHAEPDLILSRDAYHWHAYWQISDLTPTDFKVAQHRLAVFYGTDKSVCNSSRVMRLAGTVHLKDGISSRGYMLDGTASGRLAPRSSADLLAGLPELPAKVEALPSAVAGEPVTPPMLLAMLSHIDPTFAGDQMTWLGIAKALRWGQIPLTEITEADAWENILDEWCSGALWRERTGDHAFEVATYRGRDELLARLSDDPRETGATTGLGTIIKLARENGYTGPIKYSPPASQVFEKAVAEFLPDMPAPPPATVSGIFLRPVSVQKARRRITPLIEGFIPDGGTVIIHAPFNSYKSFAATDIICSVASGRAAFGKLRVNRTGPAVYIMGEGISGFETERRPAWCMARKVSDDDTLPVYTIDGVPYAREPAKAVEYFEAIKALHIRPGVVIIDTLARAMTGLNENDAGDAGLYLELVENMAKALDCAVVTIAHEGKDGERGARGSSAFAAGFDNVWRMEADTENLTARIIPVKLKDDAGVEAIHLKGQKVPMAGTAKAGLVFNAIECDEYKQARGKNTGITRSDVGRALKAIGAIPGKSVSTRVLAVEIAGNSDDELVIQAISRTLQRGAKDRFMAYVAHIGSGGKDPTLWEFPAPEREGQAHE